MRRSAKSRRKPAGIGGLLGEGLVLIAGAAMRNPMAVGGATAFAITLSYVSANALLYQPHAHPGAYFTTRVTISDGPLDERFAPSTEQPADAIGQRPPPAATSRDDEVSALIEQEVTSALPKGDPQVRLVQDVLKALDLYTGEIDGLTGPQTAKAVQRYQEIVGLTPTGRIDAELLEQLGAGGGAAASDRTADDLEALPPAAPLPVSRNPSTGAVVPNAGSATTASATQAARATDPMIVRIQAGLRAFGHDAIELDGVVGSRTRAAILEFQSLFGLPETGQPDAALFAKMREIGLAD